MDRKELEAECNEQARLNGMGAQRELRLLTEVRIAEMEAARQRAEVERLRKLVQEQDELREDVDALQSVAAALMAERDALAKDAARYRWLRSGDNDEAVLRTVKRTGEPFMLRVTALDASIDAAMAEGER